MADKFNDGVAATLAVMYRAHGDASLVRDMMGCMGVTIDELEKDKIDVSDLEILRECAKP